ncbi:MAG: 3-hydroxyacyl-CoA dehydrogenase family protein [Acidobacteria bacterium]|nr:3-hydroxyacyl-CoA dehydrogenase family protein [Acidobacteriota bacterium]
MSTIRNIAVLGLGTMGHGIAQTFAVGGCRVRGYDQSPEVRGSVAGRIEQNLRTAAQAGFGEEMAIAPALARFCVCETEAEAVQGAEFVVEAVAEDLEVKRQLFSRIESQVSAETILASNTSSFPISDIAADLSRPRRALITHWFNPPHIVPLVEVVPGEKTGAEAVEATLALLRQAGKSPVQLKKEVPGFLVNRIQIAMLREILDLLDRGVADPEEIDRAVKSTIGFRLAAIGPLEVIDFAGLDVTASVFQNLVADVRSDRELPAALEQAVRSGRFGVKSGEGIYRYTPEAVQAKVSERDRRFLALLRLFHQGSEPPDANRAQGISKQPTSEP